jgi:hypothetical protein
MTSQKKQLTPFSEQRAQFGVSKQLHAFIPKV